MEQQLSLTELLDRYTSEHAARRANYRRELTSVKTLKTECKIGEKKQG